MLLTIYILPLVLMLSMVLASLLSKRFAEFAEIVDVYAVITLTTLALIPGVNWWFFFGFLRHCAKRTKGIWLHK